MGATTTALVFGTTAAASSSPAIVFASAISLGVFSSGYYLYSLRS